MTEPSTKRARFDDEEETEPDSLKVLVEKYRDIDMSTYFEIADFVQQAEDGYEEIRRVIHATYVDDVENLGLFVTPPYLRHLTTVRDKGTSKIICIHDGKSKLEGPKLARVLCLANLKSQGYDCVIFDKEKADRTSCLALKSTWQIEEDSASKKKEHHDKIFKLFNDRGFTRVYATEEQLVQVLSHKYIPLNQVKSISGKLNTLVERGECKLELTKLVDLKTLLELHTEGQKKSESDFIDALIASAASTASWKKKVQAFKKKPSPSLARKLELKKPYQGKLYEQSTGREANMVPAGDLRPEDHVLLSTVSVDTKFYGSVSGDLDQWMVYEASQTLGVLKDKRGWVKLEGQGKMRADTFASMMRAIKKSNGTSEETTDSKGPSSEIPEDLIDDVET